MNIRKGVQNKYICSKKTRNVHLCCIILQNTSSADFAVRSTYNRIKGKIPDYLVFGQYVIFPLNYIADWKYIRQCKQE